MIMERLLVALMVVAACGDDGGTARKDARDGDGQLGDGRHADADPACANPGSIPALHAQQVVAGLTQPLYVTQPPGSTDLYVVEKGGTIKIVRGGSILPTPFLTVTDIAVLPDEGGLLSVAFAPDYVTSGRFFVYLTLSGPNRSAVREYKRSTGNPDVATATPVVELVSETSSGYDIGGTLAFGPDGKLYVGIGDAANPPDAQNLSSRHGKILRVDVDTPGTAPAGNLAGGDPFVWDYGLRNPFRFSFDRQTGDLYIGDAGDDDYEEIDVEPPATGHRNYGWDVMEGKHCNEGTSCTTTGTQPTYERAHDAGYSVLIGGNVYRGAAMPCLRGRYIFGAFGIGHVFSWVLDGGVVTSESELTDMIAVDVTNLTGFGEDQAGELYFVTMDGKLYAIVAG
jgi:glucose/arabinose dehydrogenase